jgi:hypothetical protein
MKFMEPMEPMDIVVVLDLVVVGLEGALEGLEVVLVFFLALYLET